MGKARFILKEPNSKNETLVYLVYNYNYKRFKYSTGEKINPKYWNPDPQRAKGTKSFPEHPEFNARLEKFENAINNAYRKLLNDEIQPNNTNLKFELEKQLGNSISKPNQYTFLKFVEYYIEESRSTKKPNTIKSYKTTEVYLKEFSNKVRKIEFESIDLEFYNRFTAFLTHDNNQSVNTVGKHIKNLKVFLNEATERGINTFTDFKLKRFKTIREESDNIYLNQKDLEAIHKLDYKANLGLDKTRDLFLVGCYTGLRFSDFMQIRRENINSEKTTISIRTEKTGDRVTIPIHPIVRSILEKYDYQLPNSFVNQTMNKNLKTIGEDAKINDQVETSITRGGKIEKNVSSKFQLITTHTARRSFATNLYLAEVPTISIMKITGHKTEKSFMKYIKISQEENADKLLTHPFFN